MAPVTDLPFQRLDAWLWCARIARHRSDCAALVVQGGVRLNRQMTDKPHARLRVGDVLTLAVHGEIRVLLVRALAARRGPATVAQLLYEIVPENAASPCPARDFSPYAASP